MSELRPGLAAVRDLARSAQGVREAGELLDRICASVAETFGFGRAGISRFRQETQKLELLAAHGISAEEVRQLSSSLDDWQIFKRALETRDLVFIEDVSAEHGLPPGVAEAYGVRGVLVLPLLSQDLCIGFLTADHGGEPFELDSSAAELLRTIETPEDRALRLEPLEGGKLGFTAGPPRPDDQVVQESGEEVLRIAAELSTELDGHALDRVDTSEGPRLTINRPDEPEPVG